MQLHGHDLADGAPFGGQRRLDFLQLLQLFRRPVVEQRADLIPAAHRRTEEAELHRFADDEAELLRRQRRVRAFLHPERRDAQRLHRRFEPGTAGIADSIAT